MCLARRAKYIEKMGHEIVALHIEGKRVSLQYAAGHKYATCNQARGDNQLEFICNVKRLCYTFLLVM